MGTLTRPATAVTSAIAAEVTRAVMEGEAGASNLSVNPRSGRSRGGPRTVGLLTVLAYYRHTLF